MTGCGIETIKRLLETFGTKGYTVVKAEDYVDIFDPGFPYIKLRISLQEDIVKVSVYIDKTSFIESEDVEDHIESMQRILEELSLQADIVVNSLNPICRVERDMDSLMDAYMELESIIEGS